MECRGGAPIVSSAEVELGGVWGGEAAMGVP